MNSKTTPPANFLKIGDHFNLLSNYHFSVDYKDLPGMQVDILFRTVKAQRIMGMHLYKNPEQSINYGLRMGYPESIDDQVYPKPYPQPMGIDWKARTDEEILSILDPIKNPGIIPSMAIAEAQSRGLKNYVVGNVPFNESSNQIQDFR